MPSWLGSRNTTSNGTTSRQANRCRMASSRASTAGCATSASTSTCSANLNSAQDRRRMEDRLQHQPTALEPQRAHTSRVHSTPQSRGKTGTTLLMNEDKLGSRSRGPIQSGPRLVSSRLTSQDEVNLSGCFDCLFYLVEVSCQRLDKPSTDHLSRHAQLLLLRGPIRFLLLPQQEEYLQRVFDHRSLP